MNYQINFKADLLNGNVKFGTWSMLPSSFVIDVIAQTNIDLGQRQLRT